jgi:Mn2+/Fe2+ NRAMP family transporter
MTNILATLREKWLANPWLKRIIIFLSVFGPATITAMADNDASGVATYSIAGATLGYPILFVLLIITVLLGVTQEMGMRLTLITRRGLADLIRERFGVKVSLFIFLGLFIANLGTIIVDLAAVNTTSQILGIPSIPFLIGILVVTFVFITWGNYRLTQNIMLVVCLFYIAYIFSAVKANPNWTLALSNLIYPHGTAWTGEYIRNYLIIGMGVLGTTITPWGQFFISSFAFDKKIGNNTILYSQLETYWGAFLTDFFSFFMIVATAATLYVHGIQLQDGNQAALAIKPFAGELAATLFAFGILAAGFMGIVIVSLSTAYAFSEFFGLSGSLDTDFRKSKTFYTLFLAQLLIAALVLTIPGVSLFSLAIASQVLNAMILPLIFYYLIKLTSSKTLMGVYSNNRFQKYFTIISSVVIFIASVLTIGAVVFGWQ